MMIQAMVLKDVMVTLIECTMGLFMLSTISPLLSGLRNDDDYSETQSATSNFTGATAKPSNDDGESYQKVGQQLNSEQDFLGENFLSNKQLLDSEDIALPVLSKHTSQ